MKLSGNVIKSSLPILGIIAFNFYGFSQCPQSGLKILNKECEQPKALLASITGCAEMKIKWAGNKDQAYEVNATYTDAKSGEMIQAKVSPVNNDNGNCTASVEAAEGNLLRWSVQSVCKVKGSKFYSAPVEGPETYVPTCLKEKESPAVKGFAIYPNPSKGSLIVEYTTKTASNIVLNIFDVNGKSILTQNQKAVSNSMNQYKLDLHELPPGTYMLEAVNGGETKQARFVLMKE